MKMKPELMYVVVHLSELCCFPVCIHFIHFEQCTPGEAASLATGKKLTDQIWWMYYARTGQQI